MERECTTRPEGYLRLQIILHWAVVVLLVLQFTLAASMSEVFRDRLETGTFTPGPLMAWHILGGTLVFVLVIWRLRIRHRHGAPPPPSDEPGWMRTSATAVHHSLYALLLFVPLSGAVAWAFGSAGAAGVHGLLRFLLLLLIAGHIVGAVVSHYGFRSGVITRMMRARS